MWVWSWFSSHLLSVSFRSSRRWLRCVDPRCSLSPSCFLASSGIRSLTSAVSITRGVARFIDCERNCRETEEEAENYIDWRSFLWRSADRLGSLLQTRVYRVVLSSSSYTMSMTATSISPSFLLPLTSKKMKGIFFFLFPSSVFFWFLFRVLVILSDLHDLERMRRSIR